MDLLISIYSVLSTPPLLLSFIFNAVIGTASFVAAMQCPKTYIGYVKKYLLAFLSVNFIVRCFVLILSPADLAVGTVLNGITVAAALLLLIGALFNVLSKHVGEKVTSRYRNK
jgi:hypothetical protein